MHSVERSPEPEFFQALRTAYTRWDELDSGDRHRIRNALVQDFGTICAYCEQPCQSPTENERRDEESIDHFRPRKHFPDQWLEWLNLVYACRRCNQSKGQRWPGFDDDLVNQLLKGESARYVPVSEYVNPSAHGSWRPAEGFYTFDVRTGEIAPSDEISDSEWSMARRTIMDIDLNDSKLGDNAPEHLWNLRMRQRRLLVRRLDGLDDFDAKVNIMLQFMLPDKPFSSFVRAYVNDRFPLLRHIFQQH